MLVNIWPVVYSAPAAGGQDEHQGDAGHGLWQVGGSEGQQVDWWTLFDFYSFSVILQVLHNCVLVLIQGLEAHLVSQEDPEEEEEDLNLLPNKDTKQLWEAIVVDLSTRFYGAHIYVMGGINHAYFV